MHVQNNFEGDSGDASNIKRSELPSFEGYIGTYREVSLIENSHRESLSKNDLSHERIPPKNY